MVKKTLFQIKNFNPKPFSATFLIGVMVLVILILCVSSVSAADFDDIKNYDLSKKEYTFTNLFGVGHEIGKMKLDTPQNVEVGAGYQKVAEFTITNGEEDYEEIIKGMQLYNINDGMKEFERDVDYKYQTLIDVPDYTYSCKERLLGNGTLEKYDCENIQTGTHKEMKWVDFDSNSLLKDEEITIGLFTNVEVGDNVEWIMSVYGNERLTEWATWSYELNVQLSHYWDFNENTGTNVEDIRGEVLGKQYNGTLFNDAEFRAGKDGSGIYLDGTDDFINLTVVGVSNINGSSDFTINLWTNRTADSFSSMFSDDVSNQNFDFMDSGGTIYGYMENSAWSGSSDNVTYDGSKWTMLTWTREGDNQTIYSDGYIIVSAERTQTPTQANTFRIGTDAGESNDFEGMIDEVGIWNRSLASNEIVELFNNSSGIFYSPVSLITISYPEDTITYGEEVTDLNYTFDASLEYCWQSNDSGVTNTSTVIAGVNWTTLSSAEGSNTWMLFCNDSLNLIANDSVTFTVDTTPPNVNITYPITEVNYQLLGTNFTLNWTVSDSSLDSCWYDYNGTNFTVVCSENTTGIIVTDPNNRNLTFYSNDSLGNVNNTFIEWVYRIWESSQTYVSSTVEGTINPFIINVTYDTSSWNVISGTLNYNNTEYLGTKSGSGGTVLFTSNVAAPNVDSPQNISFYWTMGLTNASGTNYINSSTYNQSVNIINMSLCGQPYTVPFLNFTIYDEQTSSKLNGTISLTFDYRQSNSTVSNSFSFSDSNENVSNYDFCISPADETYTIDSILEYDATGYAQRYYNFEGIEFTNETTEIGLYLLDTGNSTSFLVVVQDENYQPIGGVEVYMQKYDVDSGIWNTIEIATTNDDGETINHIYTEDSIYRFKIYDDGDLLHTTTGSVISCPSTPCTVTITISEELTPVLPDFEDLTNLESSLTYDKTIKLITYSYADGSGNFTQGRLHVIRSHPGVPDITYTCNSTSAIATAVLTCDLTGEVNGSYIATGYITRINEKMVERKVFNKVRNIVATIGLDGVLWSMFFLIGIIMLGVYRPSLGIIFSIFGVILLSLLQLMELSITAIVSLVGIGIILLLEVGKE